MEKKHEICYIDILKQEVKPALGCTEPIAVALAVAKACELIQGKPNKITIKVSPNILKNGMGVGIPGTGMIGLDIAASLSVICGKSAYGLEVLNDVCAEKVKLAKELIGQGIIEVRVADTEEKLYIEACACNLNNNVKVIITERHDNISYIELNGEVISVCSSEQTEEVTSGNIDIQKCGLTISNILEFVESVDIEDIRFILEAKKLNSILAEEGLSKEYGLEVGKTLYKNLDTNLIGNSLMTYSMALTAAASDARMAGCVLPAMSNSGSGNQGITVTMPVVAVAEKTGASEEKLIRALALSHLIAIHIKTNLGRLSALCGCVVASSGASSGVTYLMGGNYSQICASLKNMMGNITGMVCDGAKVGCALKVATGVSCAIQSSILSLENICISSNDGIIDECIEQTIKNLGVIGREGMCETEKIMLDIMKNKCN